MIIDTDVIIWDLRGNDRARRIIAASTPFMISVVSYMELVQGMKDKSELQTLIRQLKKWSVRILQVDNDISTRAMFYVEEYFPSHSMHMADALIAATAIDANERLLTANDRHYRQIPNIQIKKFTS